MAKIPKISTTLNAVDSALEEDFNKKNNVNFGNLGVKDLGKECDRELWLIYRWAVKPYFKSSQIKKIQAGYRGEKLQADRLRLVEGIELWTKGEDDKQIKVTAVNGHISGRIDGVIVGLKEAPTTPHVWEHKVANTRKYESLKKLLIKDKEALQLWDFIYYIQAIIEMYLMGLDRHYLTCSDYGETETISIRTNSANKVAKEYINRAADIIESTVIPDKISLNSESDNCKYCNMKQLCHGEQIMQPTCRSCAHGSPNMDGGWNCSYHNTVLTNNKEQYYGCQDHVYNPDYISNIATYIGYNEETNIITFKSVKTDKTFNNIPQGIDMEGINSQELYALSVNAIEELSNPRAKSDKALIFGDF